MIDKLRGTVTISSLIGWGITLSMALGGFFWAKITQTDNAVAEIRTTQTNTLQRTSALEEAITTLKEDNKEIKGDVKELLRRTR